MRAGRIECELSIKHIPGDDNGIITDINGYKWSIGRSHNYVNEVLTKSSKVDCEFTIHTKLVTLFEALVYLFGMIKKMIIWGM